MKLILLQMNYELKLSVILTMISQQHLRLLFAGIFFFCLGLTSQSSQNGGDVAAVDHNHAASVISVDTLCSIALPEIIALPAESVPSDLRLHERQQQDPPIDESPTAVQEEELLYLAASTIIQSGLPSTEIGYPFHAFW
jgi:hypothetical protein